MAGRHAAKMTPTRRDDAVFWNVGGPWVLPGNPDGEWIVVAVGRPFYRLFR